MTDRYAVIGNPISHSKSPLIHRMFAEQFKGQPEGDISYEAIEVPLDGFAATIERLRKEGYKGCNVTVPFKFQAFQLTTKHAPRANAAQAVNTLKFEGDTILGDNTDGAGLVADIERNRGINLQGMRVLLMGTGGAAYGVALPIWQAGAQLMSVSRDVKKARLLVEKIAMLGSNLLGEKMRGSSAEIAMLCNSFAEYDGLTGHQFDIVINATSTGLTDEMPELPPGIFAPGALAYDMMYGRKTPFMKFAEEQGAQVADGLGMLVEQAAEAFFIWRGVRPDTAPVIAALRAS